jgi:hypothetical protein
LGDSLQTLRGRLGAFALHSRYDPKETTKPARAAFMSRFERIVTERDGVLPPEELARRAEYEKRAYFTRMALASAKVRAKRGPE